MKVRLDATCDVRDGLLRVVDQEVEAVLARLAHPTADRADDVHATRLALKCLRAIWHLIRPLAVDCVAQEQNDRLRAAAALLAPQRDAVIARASLAALLDEDILPNQRAAILTVQDHLAAPTREPAAAADTENVLRKVEPVLRQTLAALRGSGWTSDGWEALAPGLGRTWAKLRRAHRDAAVRGREEDFHAWRKMVKRAQFQFGLVREAWPKRLRPMVKALRQLGDRLGDAHDLDVLRERLSDPAHPLALPAMTALVLQVIEAKQLRLRGKCQQIWAESLDDKPKGFLRRLERHYRARYGAPTGQPLAA